MDTGTNPLVDPKIQEAKISDNTQARINAPLKDPTGINPEDKTFLEMIMNKIEKGEIDLFKPASLLNHEVYDKLAQAEQGKVDYEAMTVLPTLRQIKDLWDLGHKDSFQIQNLAHQLRISKERFEEINGDVFII